MNKPNWICPFCHKEVDPELYHENCVTPIPKPEPITMKPAHSPSLPVSIIAQLEKANPFPQPSKQDQGYLEAVDNLRGMAEAQQVQSVPVSIVEQLIAANPYPDMEDLPWEPNAKSGYSVCISKLRELIEAQPFEEMEDDELQDKIMGIIDETVQEDSDHTLRGTDRAAKSIIKLFSRSASQPTGSIQILVSTLQRIVSEAENKYQLDKDDADWFNNNQPGVGQTVDYKTYSPLPSWVKEIKGLLASFTEGKQPDMEDNL